MPGRRLVPALVPFLSVTAVVYIADQITKALIVANLQPYQAVPASGLLRLTYVTNSGSAFGLLQGQTVFLILVSIIGVLGVLFYYRANGRESALLRYSLALLLGGALGNMTDRVFRGAVVDFISVQMWSDAHFPTFNIADSALTVGLIALATYVLRQRAVEKRLEEERVTHAGSMAGADSTDSVPAASDAEDGDVLAFDMESDFDMERDETETSSSQGEREPESPPDHSASVRHPDGDAADEDRGATDPAGPR